MILDEATVNLDPASTREFIQVIQSIREKRKMAILVIDHQADEWMKLTNHILVIGKKGKLIADCQPDPLFTRERQMLKEEGIFLPKIYDDTAPLTFCRFVSVYDSIMELEEIRFSRKKKTILNGVNMEVMGGELVSIVGENGAGKSTLLEIMAGILKPSRGRVNMQGKPLHQWQEIELRKRLGFVFQNPEHQFITDTVYDEMAYGMKIQHLPEEEIKRKASSLLKYFRLDQHTFCNPFALSGGQKRRLSVATALDETPDVLLFDEPTFGQDARSTRNLMETILDLRERGIAIVLVTHDMDLASQSDRIIVLHKGEIAFSGKPEKLWTQDVLVKQARICLPYHFRSKKLEGCSYDCFP